MKYWIIHFGLIITLILGGGFLIRYFRDGDFSIFWLLGGMIGMIILVIGILKKGSMKPNDTFVK